VLSKAHPSDAYEALIGIARDMTASLDPTERHQRLLAAVRRVVPCDAACLLRLEGETLVPVAAHGLVPEAMVQRFSRREHPRLDLILAADSPVRFPAESPLPDPFDGLLEADRDASIHIHACLGFPLSAEGQVVGALTADALAPAAFDGLDPRLLATLGALAGAAMRTTALIEELQRTAARRGEVARDLQRSATLSGGGEILGASRATRRLLEEIGLVAASDLAVLITGETGVGKELVARRIHALSRRADEPLIQVNCAALPESLAESELFGHVAGAFTGAARDRAGKFELADGGTLLLDEIGELPMTLQPKLLRALQHGEIQRVGSDRTLRVAVRILAATNRDLLAEVAAGRFRRDLYHRLAVYPLRVPPLRERVEDVPLLAAWFVDQARLRLGLGPVRLSEAAREALAAADWPGNVRELENVVSRGVLRASRGGPAAATAIVVGVEHLDLGPRLPAGELETSTPPPDPPHPPRPLTSRVDDFRRREILAAVERHHGNWAAAARELGVHRSNLHHLARRLGIRR
jgi:anaerobic nitric oxide reductase transcription regulator